MCVCVLGRLGVEFVRWVDVACFLHCIQHLLLGNEGRGLPRRASRPPPGPDPPDGYHGDDDGGKDEEDEGQADEEVDEDGGGVALGCPCGLWINDQILHDRGC